MNKKIIGIFVCTLLITTVLPVTGNFNRLNMDSKLDIYNPSNGGWLEERDGIKILHIIKGHRLSKQYHREKVEYMFNLNDETWKFVQPFKVHRPEAKEDDVTIVELSKGSDEDIVRLEDDYERAS